MTAAFGLGVAMLAVFFVQVSIRLREATHAWSEAEVASTLEERRLADIVRALGYGGYIHHFKNYVLREEVYHLEEMNRSAGVLEEAIPQLADELSNPTESRALEKVWETFSMYRSREHILLAGADRGVAELDQLVRVDDGPAVEAFEVLVQALRVRTNAHRKSTSEALDMATSLLGFGLLSLVLLVVLTAYLLRAMKAAFEGSRRAKRALTRANALLNGAPDGMLVVDSRGQILRANAMAGELLGHAPSDLVGRPVEDFMDPGLRDRHVELRTAHVESPTARPMQGRRLEAMRSDGVRFAVDINLSHYRLEEDLYFVVALRDVTEQRELERRLAQGQRLEALGKLTAGVAHDFNNILTTILGNVEQIADEPKDEQLVAECAKDSVKSVARAASLTSRLLAFGRRQALQNKIVDLKPVLADMQVILRRALDPSVEVNIEVSDALWPVLVDVAQLETALLNLAINARHAMPDGGRLLLEATNHEASPAGSHEDQVLIRVSDEGHGISKHDLERVFEPFFTTKASKGGSGLGLSMVYGFVTQSGGHISIESELGLGTSVDITLPRAMGIPEQDGRSQVATPPARVSPGTSVLLVEDDPDVRRVTTRHLQLAGYEVLVASCLADALAVVDSDARIDLVFSDVMLGKGETGFDLLSYLEQRTHPVPIVLATGFRDQGLPAASQRRPGLKILQKPFTRVELLRSISSELAESELPAAG